MSTFFTFIIVVGVFSSVALSHNVRDDVPWFKERERITDRFLVGMINGRNTRCTGTWNGGQVEGVCLPPRECTNLGGVKGSSCSFLGTCCILEKTCGNVTSAKLSYFVPPKVFQSDCPLTIKPMNKDVCQIRLDFEKFSIAQPTQPDDLQFGSSKSFQCYNDAFTVNTGGGYLGFEHLCGENAKQHIYIPVTNQNNVVIRFQLNPNRNNVSYLGSLPDWRIRIRQLECSRLQQYDSNSVHSNLTVMHHHHHHHHRPSNSDYLLIAPTGCLQYYPERTGYYESFNFNAAQGPYIGKTKYAICFRRTPDVCGIRHTAQFFVMSYNVREVEEDKFEVECHRGVPADATTSQDSLQIPGGMLNNQYMEYFCDEHLSNQTTVTSSVPGPLYVVVRTDAFRPFDRVEIGFRMQYQLQNTGCDVQIQ